MPRRKKHIPRRRHLERHFTGGETVRDIVIGMADGLTVPFALAAGLSGAVAATRVVVIAGLAEIAAGSIAMGLGGFLAARSEAEHYESERAREEREIVELPDEEEREVTEILKRYGMSEDEARPVVAAMARRPKAWIDFMMRFELGLEKPEPKRALTSAATIAGSYIAGGFIPLAPYMLLRQAHTALAFSAVVTLIALGIFGYVKGRYTGARPFRSGLQTVLIGGVAASAAFGLARLFS